MPAEQELAVAVAAGGGSGSAGDVELPAWMKRAGAPGSGAQADQKRARKNDISEQLLQCLAKLVLQLERQVAHLESAVYDTFAVKEEGDSLGATLVKAGKE